MSKPPPLKPDPDPEPAVAPTPKRDRGAALNRVMELIAESGAEDYLAAIAIGVRAFRDLRRKKQSGEELK